MTCWRSAVTGQWITPAMALRDLERSVRHEYPVEECKSPLEDELAHVVEGMNAANPEDTAEWLLYGLDVLGRMRAEVMGRAKPEPEQEYDRRGNGS